MYQMNTRNHNHHNNNNNNNNTNRNKNTNNNSNYQKPKPNPNYNKKLPTVTWEPEKYNIVVSSLQNYIFTEQNMGVALKPTTPTTTQLKPKISRDAKSNDAALKTRERFFIPRQKDTLFWCFYIIKNGFSKYEMEPTSYIKERNEKIKYVEMLRERKHLLKEHKIKPISDIEDYLANKEQINLKTFIALCILEGINIIILDTVTYIEYNIENSQNVFVIHKNSLSKYGIELNDSVETNHTVELNHSVEKNHSVELNHSVERILRVNPDIIQTYRDTRYKILNMDKPILSVSSYKLGELIAICKLLCINYEVTGDDLVIKKRTKQDIYNMIVSRINKID